MAEKRVFTRADLKLGSQKTQSPLFVFLKEKSWSFHNTGQILPALNTE